MVVNNKPFRIIVERIQGSWVVSRTNAQGQAFYYGRTNVFSLVSSLIDELLQARMLCRECKNCKKPFSPLRGNQECCTQHCGKKWYYAAKQPRTRILTMQEIADRNNYLKGEVKQNASESNDQGRNIEETSQGQPDNPEASRDILEQPNEPTNRANQLYRAVRAAERGTIQETPESRPTGDKPTNGLASVREGQERSEVCTSETIERHNSKQVAPPLRAHSMGQGKVFHYKCRYCSLVKQHDSLPCPAFCPKCAKQIAEDKEKSASRAPSYRILREFKKSGYKINGL